MRSSHKVASRKKLRAQGRREIQSIRKIVRSPSFSQERPFDNDTKLPQADRQRRLAIRRQKPHTLRRKEREASESYWRHYLEEAFNVPAKEAQGIVVKQRGSNTHIYYGGKPKGRSPGEMREKHGHIVIHTICNDEKEVVYWREPNEPHHPRSNCTNLSDYRRRSKQPAAA